MQSSSTAIVTIIAKNYLAQARVLMDSAEKFDPGFQRFVLLVDDIENTFDPAGENFVVVSSQDLGIPNSQWFHFKYSVLELSTAVKPYFLKWLMEHHRVDKVMYVDPDIRLYASLANIESILDHSNIVLTPHLTSELNDDRSPGELQILRTGAYNLGFIAMRACAEVDRFLLWWQSRLYSQCVVDLSRGLFVDQKWVDLVPGLYSGVHIVRDTGYNAAYWNAHDRIITWKDGVPMVNDGPLYFYHFSGYDPDLPDVLSKHQDRIRLNDREDLRTLCAGYREAVFARGYATTSRWNYTHSRFRNGCRVPDVARHLHYEAPELFEEIGDPFSDEAFEKLVQVWNTPISRSADGRTGVTKLAYRIYRMREDVQAAMPDIFGADHVRFLEWMLISSPTEHNVPEPMLNGVRTALREADRAEHTGSSKHHRTSGDLPVICADLMVNGAHDVVLSRMGKRRIDSPAAFNEIVPEDGKPARLTVLARYIYESRPDLQRVFPDPRGRDCATFLAWLLHYGCHSYGLTEEYLAPLRKSLHEIRAELRFQEKVRLDMYRGLLTVANRMGPVVASLRNVRKHGLSRYRFRNGQGSAAVAPPAPRSQSVRTPQAHAAGMNLFGYFRAETGVGQSARYAIEALTAAGIPHSLHNVDAPMLSERDGSVRNFSKEPSYGTDLYFVNADQTFVVQPLSRPASGNYKIATWTWELEDFPQEWDPAYQAYDEIWVPSSFCQVAIAARAPIPVVRVPYCISPLQGSGKDRKDFEIDSQRFIYLAVFDMRSCFDRKNPLGVMRAFKEAFGKSSECELIVKVNHSDAFPEKMKCLRKEAATGSIRLIEETLRREDMVSLLEVSDCVVSLHRSEGFGLVLGEAMLLGKPVIATAYSGNMDFTTPANSFQVSYTLQKVGPGNEPYREECLWAEPSVKDAALQMRAVYDNPQLRAQRARAGQKFIATRFSPEAVGAVMRERLDRAGKV